MLTRPLPTDELELRTLYSDTARAAADYISKTLTRDPMRDFYSDDDDYMPAAASIISAIITNHYSDDHDSIFALSAKLLADTDFLNDCLTADFDAPLFDYLDFDSLFDSL